MMRRSGREAGGLGKGDAGRATDGFVTVTPRRGLELSFLDRGRVTGPLLAMWTRRELSARYRQSVLRASWSFIQPVMLLVTYGWVLTAVLDVQTEPGVPYLTFAWAGIVPFTFLAQSLSLGVGSIQQAGSLISRVWFPREILPMSVVGCAAFDLGIMTAILVAAAWLQVGPPSVHLLGLIPVYAVLGAWTLSATLAAASLTVYRRDLNHAMPLVLRVLFIVSPVMYSADLLDEQVPYLSQFNPLSVAIEGTRDAAYREQWPELGPLAIHLAVASLLLFCAYRLFRFLEPRMSDFA